MTWKDRMTLLRDAAGEGGAGGGAGEGDKGGDGGAGDGGVPAFTWGEMDEDVTAFVGERTPQEIAKEALAHKQGATRRREQLVEDLQGDDDFINGLMEKRGLVAAAKDDKEFMAQAKARVTDETKYTMPEIEGADESLLGVYEGAARENGVLPGQLSGLLKSAHTAMVAAAEKHSETMMAEMIAADGEATVNEKSVNVEAFMAALGGDEAKTAQQAISALPPSLQKGAFDLFAKLGADIGRSEHRGDGAENGSKGGGGDPQQDWNDARAMAREAGGYDKLTDDQKAKHDAAYKRMKEQRT